LACFHLQQAVEKALKSLILFFGEEPPKVHDLSVLLSELENHINVPVYITDVLLLNDFAVKSRYPGVYFEVSEDDYSNYERIVKECIEWVNTMIIFFEYQK